MHFPVLLFPLFYYHTVMKQKYLDRIWEAEIEVKKKLKGFVMNVRTAWLWKSTSYSHE